MKNRMDFMSALLDNGYRYWEDKLKGSEGLYQKRVKDEKGTKYFLNVYHWDWTKYDPNTVRPDSFTYDGQFRLDEEGKDNTINVSFGGDFLDNDHTEVTTIEDAEKFFEDLFNKMKFDYYERN